VRKITIKLIKKSFLKWLIYHEPLALLYFPNQARMSSIEKSWRYQTIFILIAIFVQVICNYIAWTVSVLHAPLHLLHDFNKFSNIAYRPIIYRSADITIFSWSIMYVIFQLKHFNREIRHCSTIKSLCPFLMSVRSRNILIMPVLQIFANARIFPFAKNL